MRRRELTLLLLVFLTFFLGLGRQAVTDSDEAFYAEAAREMVETGDWLTPRFNYEDRWQKPVLYYWLTAATYVVAGPTEWAARWWSALAGLGLVLLTWVSARRMFGSDDVTWLAAAIVATCYGYFAMARLALPDLPLACLTTLAIWAGLERRFALLGAAVGLGFLMKGPVALAVPAVVLVPVWRREGVLTALRVRDVVVGAGVFAVVGLPWYAAMTVEHGTAYLESFFVGDNLERFATDRFNAPRAIWFYVPIVIGGMMPWSAFLLVLPARSLFAVVRRHRLLAAEEWKLLLWALMPLLLFTLSIGKQPRYILPVLPPLAILAARSIVSRLRSASGEPGNRELSGATFVTAVLFAAMAVLLFRGRVLFIGAYPWLTVIGIGALAASAADLAALAASGRWARLPAVMTRAAVVMLLTAQFGALAGVRPEPVEAMADLVRAHTTGAEPVGQYQVFVRNFGFYTRRSFASLSNEAGAVAFISSPERVLLAVREADLGNLERMSGVPMRRLGEVRYLNTAAIRMRTLFSPDPRRDQEIVLLVTNR